MSIAKLESDGLEVVLNYYGKNERIALDDYPEKYADLFREFCTFHLLAPHMPKKIKTNFSISQPMRDLITTMYTYEGQAAPMFDAPLRTIKSSNINTSNDRAVVSYSGGKDSLENLRYAKDNYGLENVLCIHETNLNRAVGSRERKSAIEQSKKIGFNLKVIELHNGASINGYKVMRSRDMFMVGVMMPYAIEFGASKIFIEGFGEVGNHEPFTGEEKNMKFFNKILKRMKLPVPIAWNNQTEIDAVKNLYTNNPDWMNLVSNCFLPQHWQMRHHDTWLNRAPTFKMYDTQCGSCVKCRMVNIGRILYDQA
jgi:hypothetical protein